MEVEVDPKGNFNKHVQEFKKYQQALAATPEAWQRIANSTKALGTQFKNMGTILKMDVLAHMHGISTYSKNVAAEWKTVKGHAKEFSLRCTRRLSTCCALRVSAQP